MHAGDGEDSTFNCPAWAHLPGCGWRAADRAAARAAPCLLLCEQSSFTLTSFPVTLTLPPFTLTAPLFTLTSP